MKILVTGFEAFLGESINPSQLLLKSAAQIPGVDTLSLPVAFEKAFPILKTQLQKENYQFVFLLGQAAQRNKISLERVAINWRETESADNEGLSAMPGHSILENGDNAYFSTLPLDEMREALQALEIPVEISYTAGAYVCNDLFYKTAHLLKNTQSRCGFIHVPFLPEQVLNKPGVASMDFKIMEAALKALIACAYQQESDI